MPFKEVLGGKILYTCDSCGRDFQFGRGIYEGRNVSEIGRLLCLSCAPRPWADDPERIAELTRRFGAV